MTCGTSLRWAFRYVGPLGTNSCLFAKVCIYSIYEWASLSKTGALCLWSVPYKVSKKKKKVEELGREKREEAREKLLVAFELCGSAGGCLGTRLQRFVCILAAGCSDLLWLILGPPPPPMQTWQLANVVILSGVKLVPKLVLGA